MTLILFDSTFDFGLGSGLGLGWLGLGLELGLGTQDLKFHKKFQHFVFEILKKKKQFFVQLFLSRF